MEHLAEAAQSTAARSDDEKPARPPLGGPAIVAEGLGIQFRANRKKRRTLRDRLMRRPVDASREPFWAVHDATFTIHHGESVALLGYNGSGKSTLLKLIAGVLLPDAGKVELDGRVAPLLELGAGFAKDLSGRENIYLSGVIQGMTREQMEERFDDIVRFSGIRRFIDTPVKHYSSGMKVRLGFAITAQLPHPILLLDEVLAVGDRRFKRKCYRRIDRLVEEGRTMVLVSHSERDVRRLCDRVLYLQDGRIIMDGGVDEVFERYNADSEEDS